VLDPARGARRVPLQGPVSRPSPVDAFLARGEYFLCTNPPGTGTDQITPMRASKAGFDTSVRDISMGNETRVDFELRGR